MRTIRKGAEPASLTQHRLIAHASFENYEDKGTLRMHLVREQRGLCCYCLSRIQPTADEMKVEHWRSREHFPDEQMNYRNLLGACRGGEGQSSDRQHCDTRKGSRLLSQNPAEVDHHVETLMRYGADGRVASDHAAWQAELEDVLNLNAPFLKNNRKATLDAFRDALRTRGELQRATLEGWLREWDGHGHHGDLRPFCEVVVYWLRKRLARA